MKGKPRTFLHFLTFFCRRYRNNHYICTNNRPLGHKYDQIFQSMRKNNMMEGETLICEARFHYVMFWLPALLVLLAVAFPFVPTGEGTLNTRLLFSGILLVLALLWYIVINNGKRFLLTNKRIILKTGIIMRNSKELMLRKCESINVRQSIMGRILGYGDVIVSTGEEKDVFKYVRNPMTFSTKINEQIDKVSSTSATEVI